MSALRLGRLPRVRRPVVPHYSALMAGRSLPPIPVSCDYSANLPADLGGMLNRTELGDCTCAAVYHAIQVWSAVAQGKMQTEPDANVKLLYERSCGYVDGDESTDRGGVEQDVLDYLLKTGAPVGPGGAQAHKIAAYVEIDPRNLDDVRRAIYEGGLVYFGMDVPQYLLDDLSDAGSTWDVRFSNARSAGGHAAFVCGYLPNGNLRAGSWGYWYEITTRFWLAQVDECYVMADPLWQEKTGLTPANVPLAELESQMQAIRMAA